MTPVRILSDLHLAHPGCRIGSIDDLRPLFEGVRDRIILNGDTCEQRNNRFVEDGAAWLEQLGARRQARALLVLGCIACVGLVLYVTVLGVDGRTWATQRRVGTVLFFSFTFLSQLLLVAGVRHSNPPPGQQRILTAMLRICLLLLSLGLLTVVLDAWDEAFYDSVEDAFEWNLSLLLQLNFLLGYVLWRRAGIALALRQ